MIEINVEVNLSETYKNFSAILKQARLAEGLTQQKAAAKIGITYQAYQAYELGKSLPSMENFLKLCAIFDTAPNDMLGIK